MGGFGAPYICSVDVELRHLRAVWAVAEERSFTAAGRRLHLSQQTVSALVRRFEINLGVTLFRRTTRSVEPTRVCEELLPDVRAALGMIEGALARARAAEDRPPPLRLAFSPAHAFGGLQDLLEAVGEQLRAALDVRELWADEIPAALCDGRFDAALCVEIQPRPGLEVRPWRRHRVDLLVAASHPFAAQEVVEVSQLDGADLVVPSLQTNIGLRDRLWATFARARVRPSLVDGPRVSGPAPVEVSRGTAATVWLSGMEDRYVPRGLRRVPLREPETVVTTSFVTTPAARSAQGRALGFVDDALQRTSHA